jgi:RNA polymerase sigma-70 factor (ECF subfamily)
MKKGEEAISYVKIKELMETERQQFLRYACYRLGDVADAEDAVQDAFIKLNDAIGASNIINVRAYFYRILSNLCTSKLRKSPKNVNVGIENIAEMASEEVENFDAEYRRINILLAQIPEEQSEVIRLRFHGDKSFAEIAEMLEVPLATVKSRFVYGMDKMRKSMNTPKEN